MQVVVSHNHNLYCVTWIINNFIFACEDNEDVKLIDLAMESIHRRSNNDVRNSSQNIRLGTCVSYSLHRIILGQQFRLKIFRLNLTEYEVRSHKMSDSNVAVVIGAPIHETLLIWISRNGCVKHA